MTWLTVSAGGGASSFTPARLGAPGGGGRPRCPSEAALCWRSSRSAEWCVTERRSVYATRAASAAARSALVPAASSYTHVWRPWWPARAGGLSRDAAGQNAREPLTRRPRHKGGIEAPGGEQGRGTHR